MTITAADIDTSRRLTMALAVIAAGNEPDAARALTRARDYVTQLIEALEVEAWD